MLLSQSVSWLALQVGSGVTDSDAGQDTGSRCSLMGGTAEASEWTQSGLGRFWPPAATGLFQWENSMATWPPRSNPAEAAQSEQKHDKKSNIILRGTSLTVKYDFSKPNIFTVNVLFYLTKSLKPKKLIHIYDTQKHQSASYEKLESLKCWHWLEK